MPHPRKALALFLLAPLAGFTAPAVDPQLPAFTARPLAAATLTVARTASTGTLADAWITAFHLVHPEITVAQTAVSTDLPARSLAELVAGEVDLAPFVREIQPQELAEATRRLGREPLGIAVASGSYATPSNTHAIAIYVNRDNPLARLTLQQLDAIYSTTRLRGWPEAITRWGQLGLTGAWADQPIHAYGMVIERKTGNPHAGIVAYLIDRLLLGGAFDPATRQVPDTGMGRGNNRALDEIADAVAADPLAIGYAGFANHRPQTKTVALAETPGQPAYAGTEAEVAARVYPLTRTIFLYARRDCSPAAREFLRFILSREGQAEVKKDPAGFLPLPDPFAALQRQKLD